MDEELPMCLGIPGKVVETYTEHDVLMGRVEFGGVYKRVCLEHVPDIAPSDIATAIRFCKTASGASRRALYQLGRAYAANRQMPVAIGAWRRAADKGSSSAMVELGVLYGTGAGVARDEAQSFDFVAARGAVVGVHGHGGDGFECFEAVDDAAKYRVAPVQFRIAAEHDIKLTAA